MSTKTTLPSVLDTIIAADRKHLNQVITKRFKDADMKTPYDGWLDELIKRFQNVDIIESHDSIIIAQTALDQDLLEPDQLELTVTSTLYTQEDLEELLTSDNEDFMPIGYAYELTTWPYLLGYRTWIPERFSKHERIKFTADMIWELTWFGDTEETVESGSEELQDSLEKSYKEYEAHKDDENYFIPANDVFEKYREELEPTDPEIKGTMEDHWSDVNQEFFHRMLDVYKLITDPIAEVNKNDLRTLANLIIGNTQ